MAKSKPFTFSLILFLFALILFTIHYLEQFHNEFQTALPYPKSSGTNPKWLEIIVGELKRDENINMGVVNMDETMVGDVHTRGRIVKVHFDRVDKGVGWSDLFPEWINESAPAKCPEIPMPRFNNYKELDVVVARVPCKDGGLRDVFRLQVNLVVAKLLVESGRINNGAVFAVFVGSCGPMWEVFRCEDLLWHVGSYWVYKPDLRRIKQKVMMPVGTCQLCTSFAHGEELHNIFETDDEEIKLKHKEASHNQSEHQQQREAYVSILHSSEAYVCGAIALAQTLIRSNTTKDLLLLLADQHISPQSSNALHASGWTIKRIQRIRNPHATKNTYNEWNYSKLRLWQLTDYDKLVFIDSDIIVNRNLDELFTLPQISAVGNDGHVFNSGVMIVEPSQCTFETLMKNRWAVRSYNGGDQGFLNEMFPWWHRLPSKFNKLKFFRSDRGGRRMGGEVYAVHYVGVKPWKCYRDYDCNWDRVETQRFASDSVHEKWWELFYDNMSHELKQYCSLSSETKARVDKNRDRAKNAGFVDGHWKINIKDPRKNIGVDDSL